MPPLLHPPPLAAPVTTLRLDLRRPITRVRPDQALGWSVDGGDAGSNAPLFDPRNRDRLRALAVHPVSYRLRTELAGEVWHWSAHGRWSDAAHAQGYWTGDPTRLDPSAVSFGYRLPRRGDSRDEANDDGWSRLDDGDPETFWKSNPYLAPPPGATRAARPEWIKIDLGADHPVDGIEVAWRDPFARHLRVQFWKGENPWSGRWVTFPTGEAEVRRSGTLSLHLSPAPQPVRFVRLLMEDPSLTAAPGAADPRDARGYAIGEIRLGAWRGSALVDAIVHAPDGRRQTRMVVSSTDPWHRKADRDPKVEQPSPLRLRDLGLLEGKRLMLPVGVLYDTPEDAAAELDYFRRFGLRPREVELGEEPEGQRTDPEVYARLYAQLAARLRARWSDLRLVGPSLINALADTWLDDDPDHSWTRRMLRALRAEAPADALQGFTLEHYPDDDLCGDATPRLVREPRVMAAVFERLRNNGVPPSAPITLTEVGQSAFTGAADLELASAVFAAEALTEFLSHGGRAAYLYSLTPAGPAAGPASCAGAGDMTAYVLDRTGLARWPTPSLAAFRLISQVWLQLGAAPTRLFPRAETDAVFAYAAYRPDRRWAVLLANPGAQARTARLRFAGGGPDPSRGAEVWRYGPDQYRWSAAAGRPLRDQRPTPTLGRRWSDALRLAPYSVTVVRDR